jgi:spore coat polysaccharide biosynthesis protein SpsF
MQVNAVIQARMGSTRLPGKVLKPLGGRSVLEWVVRAAQLASGVDRVVVATTTAAEDDLVADTARRAGASITRGPVDDVLARYALALEQHPCDAVVRLTADCPLLDPALIDLVVTMWRAAPTTDYVATTLVRTLPRGLDVELVRAQALERLSSTVTGFHRVHVTSGLYTNPEQFALLGLVVSPDSSDLRLTLDTADDEAALMAVVAALGSGAPSWRDVVQLMRARPWIAELNADVQQKTLEQG